MKMKMKMKAKKVFENVNFERTGDPKKSLGIGYTDFYGYAEKELTKIGLNHDDFWETYYDVTSDMSDKNELIEEILATLANTSLDYQINWIQSKLEQYIASKEQQEN